MFLLCAFPTCWAQPRPVEELLCLGNQPLFVPSCGSNSITLQLLSAPLSDIDAFNLEVFVLHREKVSQCRHAT